MRVTRRLDAESQQLGDEERISVGPLMQGRDETLLGRRPETGCDDLGDLVHREARDAELVQGRLAREARQRAGERIGPVGRDVPVRPGDEQRHGAEVRCKVREQFQRRTVGPVQVIEEDDRPTLNRDPTQERRGGLVQCEAGRREVIAGRRRGTTRRIRDLRDELRDRGGVVRRDGGERRVVERGDQGTKDLDPRSERRRTGRLRAPPPVGRRRRWCEPGELTQQGRLADARLTTNEEQSPVPRTEPVQCGLESPAFSPPPEHHRSIGGRVRAGRPVRVFAPRRCGRSGRHRRPCRR